MTPYQQALADLNRAAYAALKAAKDQDRPANEKGQLMALAHATDKIMEDAE